VVIRILEPCLQRVVVDIADGQLGPDPIQPDGLEFEVCHGAGGVLGECLVYPEGVFILRDMREVVFKDLRGHGPCHRCTSS